MVGRKEQQARRVDARLEGALDFAEPVGRQKKGQSGEHVNCMGAVRTGTRIGARARAAGVPKRSDGCCQESRRSPHLIAHSSSRPRDPGGLAFPRMTSAAAMGLLLKLPLPAVWRRAAGDALCAGSARSIKLNGECSKRQAACTCAIKVCIDTLVSEIRGCASVRDLFDLPGTMGEQIVGFS